MSKQEVGRSRIEAGSPPTRRGSAGPGHMGAGLTEKPKDFKGTLGKLIVYCKNYLPVILFSLVLAGAGTVLQIIGPDKLKDITNEIVKGLPALADGIPIAGAIDLGIVGRIGLLLVCLYMAAALLSFIQGYMMATITQKISRNMRTGISEKINKLP